MGAKLIFLLVFFIWSVTTSSCHAAVTYTEINSYADSLYSQKAIIKHNWETWVSQLHDKTSMHDSLLYAQSSI